MTRTSRFTVIISLISAASAGLSWSSAPSKSNQKLESNELEVNHLYRLTDNLDAYMRRPDCFRTVASSIRSQCTNMETQQNERVQAAISLTLCELATAKQHSTPMECTPFDSRLGSVSFDQSEGIQGQCVEALSRSAQHWSSYSGYLREIPQLCFAFLRWNEIDTAREVYKNTTVEHLSFLMELKRSQNIRDNSDAVASEIIQDIKRAMSQFESSSIGFQQAFDESIVSRRTREEETIDMLQHTILDLQAYNELILQSWRETMNDTATALATQHASSTMSVVSSLEAEVLARVDIWFSEAHEHYSRALQVASLVDQTLTHLRQDVDIVHQSVKELSTSTAVVASHLQTQVQESLRIQDIQKDTAETAESLAGTLSELSERAQEELNNINETASAMIVDLRAQKLLSVNGLEMWKDWSRSAIFWLLEMVLRIHVDPENFDYLAQLPVFRFIGVLSRVAWYLLQGCFSSVMGMILCLFSARRWLSDIFIRTQSPSKSKHEEPLSFTYEPQISIQNPKYRRAPSAIPTTRTRPRMSRIPQRLVDGSQYSLKL
ncbi:hypothetical protein QCA50_003049 [Cerrena zonata]|uniref:Nuclear fusion protein KAR5 n=1 Tax=Cerrena zonata TaxID=2478898 RepID=A0AAW0GVC5_9APHY